LRGLAVVVMSDLLNGFSLVDVECIVMAIVDREWWGGGTDFLDYKETEKK
jgi:hypothetical protein